MEFWYELVWLRMKLRLNHELVKCLTVKVLVERMPSTGPCDAEAADGRIGMKVKLRSFLGLGLELELKLVDWLLFELHLESSPWENSWCIGDCQEKRKGMGEGEEKKN